MQDIEWHLMDIVKIQAEFQLKTGHTRKYKQYQIKELQKILR